MRVAVLTVLLAPTAAAQTPDLTIHPSFDFETFWPTADPHGIINVDGARPLQLLDVSAGLFLQYARAPLGFCADPGTGACVPTDVATISHRTTADFVAMFGLERADVSLTLPVAIDQESDIGEPSDDQRLGGVGFGDARIGWRIGFVGFDGPWAVALGGIASLPTGRKEDFLGDASGTIESRLLADLRAGPFSYAVNTGYRWRDESVGMRNLYISDEFVWRAGASYAVVRERASVAFSIFGVMGLKGDPSIPGDEPGEEERPVEALGGARVALPHGLVAEAGGGPGLTGGYGTPAWRVFAGVRMSGLTGDFDRDGVPDSRDACRGLAEDRDEFADHDGCPEDDNDTDGIDDAEDACRGVAEDRDGFEDGDGCPEDDDDRDRIADAKDACRGVAEDRDGFEDDDGCPDPDDDGDGVLDEDDQCRAEVEVVNGYEDEDGCPDAGPPVALPEIVVDIAELVYFDYGTAIVRPGSGPPLARVAAILKRHPEIRKIRIDGYADDFDDDQKNLELSRLRAHTVWLHLTKSDGIEPERLEWDGYGRPEPKRRHAGPLEARAEGWRVEFLIVERNDEP
ncbi:MAG: OmpA family protein [Myxococcota bacterium]